MPYVNKPRPYKKEYEEYHSSEEQKKNRAKRNSARRKLEKAGRVRKGDGKEVDHKKPISKGGGNGNSNLRVVSKKKNRSFARNSDSSVKAAAISEKRNKT
jgi:5-methylcytosine-specific restriction endonuclease McrA